MSLLCAGGGRIVPADMLEVFLEYLGAHIVLISVLTSDLFVAGRQRATDGFALRCS